MIHHVCSKCDNLIEGVPWLNNFTEIKQSCVKCEGDLIQFITFDIIGQLELILDESKITQIKKNISRARNKSSGELNDPMDAKIYQTFLRKNFADFLVISFILSTDGAPLTTSKNYKMWPVFGTILELDQTSREKFDNIVFFGKYL